MSNAFCKSIGTSLIKRRESEPVSILSIRYEKPVSVEWFLRDPDW